MSAIVSKAAGLANSLISKSNELVTKSIYWSKVGLELSKNVIQKEGMGIPTGKQFESVYQCAVKLIKSPQEQQKLIEQAKKFRPDTKQAVQYGVYGVQIVGFFSLGEIIGRRSLFGYPKLDNSHHH
ncbi:ATP synthase subunit G atp20 [Lodderomyces elongisporus]|uniref:ATP synthase subunit g, mitochondrial n=1 Tax=Lodderomyces elongisporus (strain ATCC 11503 / CBS 2605 / JCM 1781 / NBRC 1676 / NRRL YB-4239) TaxID=379508 RepID=A5E1N3_LODEL|nr:ATP synthase subunit G atp20 [Lodderomyces elongisporus]EDK45341.1 hypothetical protein LELG_03520 [Lodderomyces elongisporus NRRL YB-4239]WLF79258.1 ATP synthase subunit G atp20 [Lodderomyces elongisporus]